LTHHPQKGWINLLNAKLDVIISKLSLQFEGFHAMPFRYVTLSGSGMGFSSQEAFALCDLLEIKMMLTLNRPVALYLYGEVVKIQRQTSGYFIAVLFKMMDEAIRERIIQFVFEMEREMLRERKEN
jgi:c-di-GMP-binding flagellar brake protein YcgR